MDTFGLRVLSPAGLVLDEQVSSVTIPSSEGEVGILPGHVGYIALLGTGVLEATTAAGATKKLVVSGGFCNFSKNILTILADAIDQAGEREMGDVRAAERDLEKSLETLSMYEPEWQAKKDKLLRLQALETLS